ncbi:hypothetical protein [Arsenophonus apicola]|uniref:Uncharacterized protein n=1 Tax=Arsenophonus apicola TaxID=2879119 RepID=A0ABY8P1I6_9GAMM|nr:hypothetical protein [Arsenophonus apicola]WGO83357.1 hypothetical protein QG404_13615 [Arsenophonus apicola]
MTKWCDPSDKDEVERHLQTLSHHQSIDNTETVYAKLSAFIRLATLAGETHRHDFKIQFSPYMDMSKVDSYNGFNQITLSVKDVLNKESIWFGEPMYELFCAMKVPLTNSSEYLAAKSSMSEEEIHSFMQKELALIIDDNDSQSFRLQGIEDKNQERLDIAKFSLEVRQKLMENKQFLQSFIMAKMKCFDYFSATASSLSSIISELACHNSFEMAQNLKGEFDKVRENTEQTLFNLFNQKNIDTENIIEHCYMLMK